MRMGVGCRVSCLSSCERMYVCIRYITARKLSLFDTTSRDERLVSVLLWGNPEYLSRACITVSIPKTRSHNIQAEHHDLCLPILPCPFLSVS